MYEENNAGSRGVGFRPGSGRVQAGLGQTVHAGVSGCVGFRLKNLRARSSQVVIFRPVENSSLHHFSNTVMNIVMCLTHITRTSRA